MDEQFDYFQYTVPNKSVDYYVSRAVDALKDIKAHHPKYYQNFIYPSEVLTLSGVRAFDTYYSLGRNATKVEINHLKQTLQNHDVLLIEDTFEIANESNEEHNYSIIHKKALLEIPDYYRRLPEPGWNAPNFQVMHNDTDFYLWWFLWQFAISARIDQDPILKEWSKNNPTISNTVVFGITLGYPGIAISSNLKHNNDNNQQNSMLSSQINYATAFDGAQPIYSYHKNVADNPQIKAHEKLWSGILKGVYSLLEPEIIKY